MDLVTVATFPDLAEAELAKERLSSEGIPAYVQNASTAGIMPFLNSAGIAVQVEAEHAARAREILAS